ncbi:MAG: glycosyltransferase family 4 protein, partial [Chloroflexota bacterium]
MSEALRGQRGLRIAFDGRYVRDSFGGIARFAFCLLSALVREDADATYLVYYDPVQKASRFDLAGVLQQPNVVARPLSAPLYSLREQIIWPLTLGRDRADVFYSPYFALPLLARRPCVCTVHDLIFELEPAYRHGNWVRAYYFPMMRLALRRAAAVLAVSETTKGRLMTHYGTDAGRVTVVSEAAADTFQPSPDGRLVAEAKQALALPERYVLAVGARRPHKNLGAAVRAFAMIQPEVPHSLVLVGAPERRYADDVAAALDELGSGVRVHELASVDERYLPALYHLAEVVVIPSLHEGFGLPALEAMATGTPVVTSNRGALPEVVGEAGILVDPTDLAGLANALRRVLGDEETRNELRRRG